MAKINTLNYQTVASWNGSQDLFIVEQPDGTKVATPDMVKQYVLNNMDEVPTQDSNKPVKSGGIFNSEDDIWKANGMLGAKNLYNSQYSVPRTNAGTTATLGDDGHVIMNGTANADAAQFSRPGTSIKPIKDLKVGDKLILSYKVISGTFTHGSSNRNTTLYFNNKNNSAVDPIIFPLSLSAGDSDSKEIALTNECFTDGILDLKDIQIYMRSGDTFNNLELAIMLRLASDTDDTYQPYAKTNRQLTEDKAEVESVRDYVNEFGAKNLIPYPYYRPNHYEINGITYDVSSDGVITMQTGTSTAEADYHMWHRSNADTSFHLDKGTYILSGCDTNAPGGVSLIINGKAKNGNDKNVATQNSRYPDGVEFTIDDTFDLDRFGVLIYCSSGVTISSALTFKPMIRLVSDINDDTYQPYAKTNRQLTEVIGDLSQTSVTGATVAAQLGVLGNILSFTHFVQIPFTTSVLDSIKAAFENNTIPVDIYGITLGIVSGGAGSQRVIFIAQNQRLSTTQTRYAAIYFGAYTAPRFLQKQDGTEWTDVAL